ncbi:hypothetical protein AAC387_Pa03g2575 [Persea americana]
MSSFMPEISSAESKDSFYTIADSPASSSVIGDAADTTAQKNGGWFGFVSDAMVFILKQEQEALDCYMLQVI